MRGIQMKKIKVLIADDHHMVRQGIKQILELENDIEVVSQASNGEEAVEFARQYKPDVILMDINMPGMNGLQAIEELKRTMICTGLLSSQYIRIGNICLKRYSLGRKDMFQRMLNRLF
jgi:DNA-binding NarL/FixJ family response regulator